MMSLDPNYQDPVESGIFHQTPKPPRRILETSRYACDVIDPWLGRLLKVAIGLLARPVPLTFAEDL